MCLGISLGWLTRVTPHLRTVAGKINTVTIMLLMLLLGADVGGNDFVLSNLDSIGVAAMLLGVGGVVGSAFAAKLLWRYSFSKVAPRPIDISIGDQMAATESVGSSAPTSKESVATTGNHFSIMVVGSFIAGGVLGAVTPLGAVASTGGITVWVLYVMMFTVGIGVGSDTATLRNIVRQPRRSVLVPVATVVGTWAGVMAAWVIIRWLTGVGLTATDSLAIGSGFGYYSLSTVIIGEIRGPEIATISLLANILRELIAVTTAPWLRLRFSPLAPICVGGATTVDVTLPVIIRCCGPEWMALAIFQGVVVDLLVPVLVPFFGLA